MILRVFTGILPANHDRKLQCKTHWLTPLPTHPRDPASGERQYTK
jgi:hypothetical protein